MKTRCFATPCSRPFQLDLYAIRANAPPERPGRQTETVDAVDAHRAPRAIVTPTLRAHARPLRRPEPFAREPREPKEAVAAGPETRPRAATPSTRTAHAARPPAPRNSGHARPSE